MKIVIIFIEHIQKLFFFKKLIYLTAWFVYVTRIVFNTKSNK